MVLLFLKFLACLPLIYQAVSDAVEPSSSLSYYLSADWAQCAVKRHDVDVVVAVSIHLGPSEMEADQQSPVEMPIFVVQPAVPRVTAIPDLHI